MPFFHLEENFATELQEPPPVPVPEKHLQHLVQVKLQSQQLAEPHTQQHSFGLPSLAVSVHQLLQVPANFKICQVAE
jgi:hypothetical protein